MIKTGEDVKELINLKTNNWNNPKSTNCYSYAIGLDSDELHICPNFTQLGYIWLYLCGNKGFNINELSYLERFVIDMSAIGIDFSLAHEEEESICDVDEQGYLSWIIAMYQRDGSYPDYHFFRKNKDGIWSSKKGRYKYPTNLDENGNKIIDLNDLKVLGYEDYYQVGVYKLRMKK